MRPWASTRICCPIWSRRLLENGANTSFVNRLADDEAPVASHHARPGRGAERERTTPAGVKLSARPRDIFWPERKNSAGVALTDTAARAALVQQMEQALTPGFEVGPIIDGTETAAAALPCQRRLSARLAPSASAPSASRRRRRWRRAIASSPSAAHGWDKLGAPARARILDYTADMVERDRARLMAVLVREGGKTLPAALAEVREAADLLRYYAAEARRLMSTPMVLKGPTGEANTLELRPRGPFACIAPWNFPLAIFMGQIAAALAAGNTVLAKPAEETPVSAFLAVKLFHEAGVPKDVLQLLTGGGSVGAALVKSPLVKGVAFTGGNDTAWAIQKALADRGGEIVPFIAETGGINAMIADSSALTEQIVRDVGRSAYDSAGQRCSALRVLFLQDDVANRTIRMLTGAIEALDIGRSVRLCDRHRPGHQRDGAGQPRGSQGPHAGVRPRAHRRCACRRTAAPEPTSRQRPTRSSAWTFSIGRSSAHSAHRPLRPGHLDKVVEAVNASGFGLTLAVHSRIGAVADYVAEHARVGNLYVNRNQIGAVPGVQPFGGEGLSGTGPKAGGPNYLARFATERVRTTDITATGGNIALLTKDTTDLG